MDTIKICVITKSPGFYTSLEPALNTNGIVIEKMYPSWKYAIARLEPGQVNVILIDVNWPMLSLADAIECFKIKCPETYLICVTEDYHYTNNQSFSKLNAKGSFWKLMIDKRPIFHCIKKVSIGATSFVELNVEKSIPIKRMAVVNLMNKQNKN